MSTNNARNLFLDIHFGPTYAIPAAILYSTVDVASYLDREGSPSPCHGRCAESATPWWWSSACWFALLLSQPGNLFVLLLLMMILRPIESKTSLFVNGNRCFGRHTSTSAPHESQLKQTPHFRLG